MIWILLLVFLASAGVTGTVYLMKRARRFWPAKQLSEKNKVLGWIASAWPLYICLPFLAVNVYAFVIAYVNLILIWAACDLVGYIIRRLRKKERREHYVIGWIAVGLTACYLTWGWISAHTVLRTEYRFETAKELGRESLRVAVIADLHVGLTLDGDEFAEQCRRIAEEKPDLVVAAGDFADDDSTRSDMIKACEALGNIPAELGVYWVYGNHDRGYFSYRDFTAEEMAETLARCGVKVLSDETADADGHITVVGREDKGNGGRLSAGELMKGIDPSRYVIMLDHQPNDYTAEAEAGPDLVISGHTHGGHIFPAGLVGQLTGANDRLYGTERRGNTDFLVTSGISGWGIPFKTFAVSEYVVVDIYPTK